MSNEKIVEVSSIKDLPDPVDGVITLAGNTVYRIETNLGSLRLAVNPIAAPPMEKLRGMLAIQQSLNHLNSLASRKW